MQVRQERKGRGPLGGQRRLQPCRRAAQAHYTPATRDWLHSATGESIGIALVDANGTALDQAIAMLRHSHLEWPHLEWQGARVA